MTRGAAHVSVVICAYTEKRWEDLLAAVASVDRQCLPAQEIIVVVDHNDQLLERVRANISGVTVVENRGQQGLSGARNTGIEAAHGSLIAFLDDDAVADPNWLKLLVGACIDVCVLGSGGLVKPAWQNCEPRWFPEEFHWVIGCSYRGLPKTRDTVRNIIGSSMCVRREVFDAVGGFRSDIGRFGKRPAGCEETELCIRALQYWPQRTFVYEPEARIRHTVPASRTRWGYFCSRCYYEGRSKALVTQFVGVGLGLYSERSYTMKTLPGGVVRGVSDAVLRHDLAGLARAGAIVAGLAITASGYLMGAIAQRRMRWKVAGSAWATRLRGGWLAGTSMPHQQGR